MDNSRSDIRVNASGELYVEDERGRLTRLYRFREALAAAGINTMTFYQWVKQGLVPDAHYRNEGCWRLFTESEVQRLISVADSPNGVNGGWQAKAAAANPRKDERSRTG